VTDRAGNYIADSVQASSLEKSGRPAQTNVVAVSAATLGLNCLTPVASAVSYRMRAYDTTLTYIVYWTADHVDADGSQYVGPGPLTGIVVSKQLGA